MLKLRDKINPEWEYVLIMQNFLRTDLINVDGGNITGIMTSDKAVNVFKGIPYAAPPVNNLRWKAPQPVIKWDGVRECVSWEKSAIQAKQEAFLMWSQEFIIDTTRGYSVLCGGSFCLREYRRCCSVF